VDENFTETLTAIISLSNESWGELGKRFSLTKPQISQLKNGRIEPNKHLRKRFEDELAQLRSREQSVKITESTPSYGSKSEAQPIGNIPFRGRDWSMDVPVYADAARNEAVMLAAARLLSVARGDAQARIVAQADADAMEPFLRPQPVSAN